ncbi:hypothetical protein GCM10020358_60850 [Amorphoplanes nipponensis]|uniref:SalK n=1 Tax=Actinoplanes nipponensis TaxID=135950 RepID=A0A919JS22_9ACTN|nr:hypothetical protein [Actinoplanes nipponensis]GIE54432.1 hypothetical protein Ani05nite_79660 [Actinoplanes nipponensis]
MGTDAVARRLWELYEPLHAVTYFAPEARAAFVDAGLRGFWRGYFAGRAAPLGPVPAAPVTALFFSFAPAMVARALPDVWQRASPEQTLAARTDGAVAALRALLPPDPPRWAEAADLLEAAARAAATDGRALGAANAALPRPDDALARLWLAATVLREHRGDGHIAALVTAGLTGREALVLRDALYGGRDQLQPNRGWTDAEWDDARRALAHRGWLDDDGRPTAAGADVHRVVEDRTDQLAAQPWSPLSPADRTRLAELLTPLAAAAEVVIPYPNPMGVPRAGRADRASSQATGTDNPYISSP